MEEYIKYEIHNDLKCPACGNCECIKIPKRGVIGGNIQTGYILEPFPAICVSCGCMFITKEDIQKIFGDYKLVNRVDSEDKKENQPQNSVDEF